VGEVHFLKQRYRGHEIWKPRGSGKKKDISDGKANRKKDIR